jgi:crotonobetainyl-CoA:carnitine CoA-transferase CaiB-like acyl-CoA transferase
MTSRGDVVQYRLQQRGARPHSTPCPLPGEHNQHVFGELLGLPAAQIQRLVETGAIY